MIGLMRSTPAYYQRHNDSSAMIGQYNNACEEHSPHMPALAGRSTIVMLMYLVVCV